MAILILSSIGTGIVLGIYTQTEYEEGFRGVPAPRSKKRTSGRMSSSRAGNGCRPRWNRWATP